MGDWVGGCVSVSNTKMTVHYHIKFVDNGITNLIGKCTNFDTIITNLM